LKGGIDILIQILFGLIFGLLGSPVLIYFCGSIVVFLKERGHQKQVQEMKAIHNKRIEELRKQYEKDRKSFNNLNRKMQRIVAKANKKGA